MISGASRPPWEVATTEGHIKKRDDVSFILERKKCISRINMGWDGPRVIRVLDPPPAPDKVINTN